MLDRRGNEIKISSPIWPLQSLSGTLNSDLTPQCTRVQLGPTTCCLYDMDPFAFADTSWPLLCTVVEYSRKAAPNRLNKSYIMSVFATEIVSKVSKPSNLSYVLMANTCLRHVFKMNK